MSVIAAKFAAFRRLAALAGQFNQRQVAQLSCRFDHLPDRRWRMPYITQTRLNLDRIIREARRLFADPADLFLIFLDIGRRRNLYLPGSGLRLVELAHDAKTYKGVMDIRSKLARRNTEFNTRVKVVLS